MPNSKSGRMYTLVRREMQESRNSLVWTPVAIAVALMLIMLVSVLLANRITVIGDTMLQVLLDEESAGSMEITIGVEDQDGQESSSYTIEKNEGPVNEEDWDFSKEWDFEPKTGAELQGQIQGELDERIENLNPVLNMVHNFLVLVLFLVSVTYLLASLYNDRKDRSILFWRSMPVSEWEEVLSKLVVVLVVAPAIFIAVSMLIQVAYILIAMLLVWRLDMDPFQLILGNIEFGSLFFNQISGWLLTALWVAPVYAWLLLASAGAKRSPFMLAIAPVIALGAIEEIFMGSEFIAHAIGNHIPHYIEGADSLGFYIYGPDWASINYLGMILGLIFAAAALTGAVYLRRYRFEI
jgi:ABC-2 type transport system permease protein